MGVPKDDVLACVANLRGVWNCSRFQVQGAKRLFLVLRQRLIPDQAVAGVITEGFDPPLALNDVGLHLEPLLLQDGAVHVLEAGGYSQHQRRDSR
jgi:hypothetical protein